MTMPVTRLHRRDLLKMSAVGAVGYSTSGWLEALARQSAVKRRRHKSCILLWMSGGPSQIDTFDPKPGHANGGPFDVTDTTVPGIHISEHLPGLAAQMRDIAIIRSMSTQEMDHGRASHLLRTGYLPQGALQFPTLGSLVSKELGASDNPLPNFISIAPYRIFNQAAYASGFLGPQHAPLIIADAGQAGVQPGPNGDYEQALRVRDLTPPSGMGRAQVEARIDLLDGLDRDFVGPRPGAATDSHRSAVDRAARLMLTPAGRAFDLEQESSRLRDLYGRNLFGQGCLMARRLVERGVPFVEVSLGTFGIGNQQAPANAAWDTHGDTFNIVRRLSEMLDAGWSALMIDLRDRGLLDSTLIVWMGEFGRTPMINPNNGREHYTAAFSAVLAGGGIRGGQVIGATSPDGSVVQANRPTSVPDLMATVVRALGIDPVRQNLSNVGRPIRIVDGAGQPIQAIL
jgi:hypothetical protein